MFIFSAIYEYDILSSDNLVVITIYEGTFFDPLGIMGDLSLLCSPLPSLFHPWGSLRMLILELDVFQLTALFLPRINSV